MKLSLRGILESAATIRHHYLRKQANFSSLLPAILRELGSPAFFT
jgi:hypothetical protein